MKKTIGIPHPIEMVLVEGGTFYMGKKYRIELTDYEIGKYLITQKQWQEITGHNPSSFKGENLPVERVDWENVQDFLERLNQKYPGMNYRLPSEAEWEFAALGGNKTKWYRYSGGMNLDEVGWYYKNSEERTHPVGQKKANELGIFDMSGNVAEWCGDWFGELPTGFYKNPQGPRSGSSRVTRGGYFETYYSKCEVSHRYYRSPCCFGYDLGLRLARSL